ncbi:hypothetical protein B0T10DRAFT_493468 [Thelonectria olida]|uniref:Uncharacterized protein n=1 Tax=Thelonectria olida TaxID=1576542 RepID=A0A9P8W1K5_9HYPO|nr:hypothetical protein B0T10DRAFT_493468 [Thelonectria olida]
MQLSTLLLYITASISLTSAIAIPEAGDSTQHLQKRACFKTGENFGNQRDLAQDKARFACNKHFKGNWKKRETVVKCYDLGSSGKSVLLTVGLTGPNAGSTRYLDPDECFSGLSSEILNCGKGGDTTYGNWRYRADPNSGGC